MQRWDHNTDRALGAYLRAVIFAEPVQIELLNKYGIRLPELRALRLLHDLGPTPIGCFADRFGMSRSTATGLMDRLEQRNLVCREASPDDRRVTKVKVTKHGLRALEDRDLFRRSQPGQQISKLTKDEQMALADLLDKVATDPAVPAEAVSAT